VPSDSFCLSNTTDLQTAVKGFAMSTGRAFSDDHEPVFGDAWALKEDVVYLLVDVCFT
jgi:hypothetical protein